MASATIVRISRFPAPLRMFVTRTGETSRRRESSARVMTGFASCISRQMFSVIWKENENVLNSTLFSSSARSHDFCCSFVRPHRPHGHPLPRERGASDDVVFFPLPGRGWRVATGEGALGIGWMLPFRRHACREVTISVVPSFALTRPHGHPLPRERGASDDVDFFPLTGVRVARSDG